MFLLTQESELPSGFYNTAQIPSSGKEAFVLCAFHKSDRNALHFLQPDHPSFTLHCFELSFFQEWSSLAQSNHAMHTTFHHSELNDLCLAMPSYPEIVLYELEKNALQ